MSEFKTLRMAVISAGAIGVAHMRACYMNYSTDLVAIAEPDEGRLKSAAELYHIAEKDRYTDWREMIKRDDIDAVIVASPDQYHAEHTIACLEAGKHVLCEKPFALTREDCQAMIDAQRRTGLKLMVGQAGRYSPGFVKAKELITSGIIGEIFYAESEYAHDYSKIPGQAINGQPCNWRHDPKRHGILGGGCHALDMLRWMVGNPTEVTSYANRMMLKDWPTDDTSITIMRFPNGAIGKVFVSIGVKRNYTMRSCFYGSKGSIICDNTSDHLMLYRTDLEDKGISFTTPLKIDIEPESHNLKAEVSEFADIVLNNEEVKLTAVEGSCTVALALAAVESNAIGGPVKVDYNF